MRPWYTVVTFGTPTRYTRTVLGNPDRVGRRVSRDLDQVRERARALRGHVSDVRVLEARTRAEARNADIAGSLPVVGC